MDSSPTKRRRTSPSTSIAVTVENTDLGPSPQNGTNPSRRRSSFMSPTKASLARFHPSLLPRAKSAEPPRPVSKDLPGTIEQESVVPGGTNGIGHVADAASNVLESEMNGMEKSQGLLATPRRRSQDPGEGSSSAKQAQSLINPGPRASPPEEARDKGAAVNGTNGAQHGPIAEVADVGSTDITVVPDRQNSHIPSTPTQSRPYIPTSGMGVGEDGEPSLPSTPSQLGLEPPQERPNGLLFSSPSRRLRRKGRSSAKSSPLKSLDVPSEHPNQEQKSSIVNLGPRRYIINTPKPPPPPEETRLLELQTRLGDAEQQLQNIEDTVLRQLLVSSWQQEGSKEGKYMAKQNKEILQRSIKIVQLRDEVLQIQATQNIDHRQARPEETDRKSASTKPSSLTRRLANFLPFSIKPLPPEPRPPSHKNMDVVQVLDLDVHQIATVPFTITTSNTLLLPPTVDNDFLQRQVVTMTTPLQLLTCDLQIAANITTQQISQVDVQALSPWAESELGSWLRQSREKMELVALGRAFGRYWEVAKFRGKCWIKCKQDFTSLVVNAPESNSPLLHLGMQELVFARSNVQLKVTWRISLSDQGEVESHSSACPRFPAAWQQEANSGLAKIGDAFLMLVEDRGISEAIGMICKVVFPT
ncbi:MAG: hypothetical protein Q9161_001207 [Pseudevernia consocians]